MPGNKVGRKMREREPCLKMENGNKFKAKRDLIEEFYTPKPSDTRVFLELLIPLDIDIF